MNKTNNNNIHIDEEAAACLIDGLTVICKSKKIEEFNIVSNEEVDKLYEKIKSGDASHNDFEDVSSNNIIWSSLLLMFNDTTIYTTYNLPTSQLLNDYTIKIPGYIQRLLGALLCTIDYILEYTPNHIEFYVYSLYKVLLNDNIIYNKYLTNISINNNINLIDAKEKSQFLSLFISEYRSLFPFCFMFTRRIGKSPKQQLNIWNNYLSNVTTNKTSVLDDDYQSNNNITGWSYEEDEDADIPDYKSNHLHTKKRTTRMRNNNSTTNTIAANASINSLTSSASSSNLKHSTRITSGLSDSFLNEYKSSSRHNSFDDIEDIPIVNTTTNNLTNNATNNQTNSLSNSINKKSVKFVDSNSGSDTNTNNNIYNNMKPTNVPSDEKSLDSNSNINVVTIEDLRSTFNDNMITKTTAYKTNLSLDVRIHLKAPALSDDILVLSGNSITWNELLDLAQPYFKRNKEITLPTVNRYTISPNTSSNRLSATSLLRESDVRSFSSDDDNSSPDKSPDITPEKYKDSIIDRYMTRSSDKTIDKSIDKSIEKSPDKTIDKSIIKSGDRPLDRSKGNNFNQPTSQLSKITLLDNSTNVYSKNQTTYPNSRNGISVNNSVDSINNEKWNVNDSIDTTRSIDSNISSNSPTKSQINSLDIVESPNKQLYNHVSGNSLVNSPNNNVTSQDSSSSKVNSSVNKIVALSKSSNQVNTKINNQTNNTNQNQNKNDNQANNHTTSNGQPPINPVIKSNNSGSFHTSNSSSTDISDQLNINSKKINDLQSFDGSFYLSDSSMDDSFYTSKKSNSSRNNSFRFDLTSNNTNNNVNLNKIIEEEYETQSELDENKSIDLPIDDSQNVGKQIDKSKGKIQPPLMSNSPKSKSYSMKIASFFSRKSGSKMNDTNVSNNVPSSPPNNNDVNISPSSNTTVSSQTNVQTNQSVHSTPDNITSNDVDSNIHVLTTKSSKLILPIPIVSNNPNVSLSKSIMFDKVFPHLVTVPLSEYAQMSGIIIESWLEKKSKRTGLWNKKYYVLSESNSDFCILKIFKKAVETVWGIVGIDIKSVITVKSIDMIRLVNAKSGKDFDIVLKPKETLNKIKSNPLTSSTQSLNISPDNNIITLSNRSNSMNNIISSYPSNNQINNQSIDSTNNIPNNLSNSQILQRPNLSDSVNSNQMISLHRSLSSNNNLDGAGSVNSDSMNYNNLNPTLVMHLRALDAQTRLLWMNSLQHILDIYNNQYSD